jgi:hypothetical protein
MRKSMTMTCSGESKCAGMMPNVTDVVMTKAHAVKTMEGAVITVEATAVEATAVEAAETSGIHWSRHRSQQCREDCESSAPAHRSLLTVGNTSACES